MPCYWRKPECTWESCREITAYNLSKKDSNALRIKDEKKCGGFCAESFWAKLEKTLTNEDKENFASFILAFITKGNEVLKRI